jgi:hypothetical protein
MMEIEDAAVVGGTPNGRWLPEALAAERVDGVSRQLRPFDDVAA